MSKKQWFVPLSLEEAQHIFEQKLRLMDSQAELDWDLDGDLLDLKLAASYSALSARWLAIGSPIRGLSCEDRLLGLMLSLFINGRLDMLH